MQKQRILNGRGLMLDLSHEPKVMGIINLNEDSFYAPSRIKNLDALKQRIEEMLEEEVDILDIGSMSSRPGAKLSDPEEERKKILTAVQFIRKNYPEIFLSIDTVWSEVADLALKEGANMINDISAGKIDNKIHDVVLEHDVPYVLMHMVGIPENMQSFTHYDDALLSVFTFFANQTRYLREKGLKQIVLDPGIGFSKGLRDNFNIIQNLESFQVFEHPVLLGISRKSFIYKSLNISPEETLNATSALHLSALQRGIDILRVHDVREAKQVVRISQLLKKG